MGRCSVDTPLRWAPFSPFIPLSLPSSHSLSLPHPSFLPSFHLWRTCCVPGTVSSAAHKKARRERRSLCLGKVWSGTGEPSPPRPTPSPLSVCFPTVCSCHWRFVGLQLRPWVHTLPAAAPALQRQPRGAAIFALWLLPQVH